MLHGVEPEPGDLDITPALDRENLARLAGVAQIRTTRIRSMKLTDRIRRWWKPAQWHDDHPLSDEERARRTNPDAPDGYVDPQHGFGAESYDRIDVERDLRKP